MKKAISKFLGVMLAGIFASTLALGQTTDSTSTMSPGISSSTMPKIDIVQEVMKTRDLSTLATALKVSGLVNTPKGKGPYKNSGRSGTKHC